MTQNAFNKNPRINRQDLAELHDDLVGWAFSLVGDDAEDVVQQCYVLVLDGEARFEGRSSLKTWLFGVIKNLSRKHRRWQRLWSVVGGAQDDLVSSTPDTHLDQLKGEIRRSITQLPKRQREVLELHTYQEFTLEECAAVLSISVGSVRTHFHRAKATLRDSLGAPTSE